MVRAFIAVNLDQHIRNEMEQLQDDLNTGISGFRWVKAELLHITLKFLGEVEPAVISRVTELLEPVGSKHKAFNLSFARLGAFPNLKKPRVIWIGVEQGAAELAGLARDINQALKEIHGNIEVFRPHLTIGRVKKNETPYLPRHISEKPWRIRKVLPVDSFSLVESQLFPSGPVYRPVQKFLLK